MAIWGGLSVCTGMQQFGLIHDHHFQSLPMTGFAEGSVISQLI